MLIKIKFIHNFIKIISADFCQSSPNYCNGNGACMISNNGSINCLCFQDYSGLTCSFSTSQCSNSSLCNNGGTCITTNSIIDGYTCSCYSGYMGKNCESKFRISKFA